MKPGSVKKDPLRICTVWFVGLTVALVAFYAWPRYWAWDTPARWLILKSAAINAFTLVLAFLQLNIRSYSVFDSENNALSAKAIRGVSIVTACLIIGMTLFNIYVQWSYFWRAVLVTGYSLEAVQHQVAFCMLSLIAMTIGVFKQKNKLKKKSTPAFFNYTSAGLCLSVITAFVGIDLFFYYAVGCMFVLYINSLVERAHLKKLNKRLALQGTLQDKTKIFFDLVFMAAKESQGLTALLVMLLSLIVVPVILHYYNVKWLAIIVETGAFLIGNMLLMYLLLRYNHMELSVRVADFILSQTPADHKNYEQVYNFYRSYQFDKSCKEFYVYLLKNLPSPVFVKKSKTPFHVSKINDSVAGPDDKKVFPAQEFSQSPQETIAALQPAPDTMENVPATEEYKTVGKQKVTKKQPAGLDKGAMLKALYEESINHVAAQLTIGLSVLVKCDKLVAEYLSVAILEKASLSHDVLEPVDIESGNQTLVASQLRALRGKVNNIGKETVLVIPYLDMMAGGNGAYLSDAGREVTQLLYGTKDTVVLAFIDATFDIPKILSNRFSITKEVEGMPRIVEKEGRVCSSFDYLLTPGELSFLQNFNPDEIYPLISGMNPLKIREAITYAINERHNTDYVSMPQLKEAIRTFKANASPEFIVPDVKFSDIGGYDDVKERLMETIELIKENSREGGDPLGQKLIPRGFLLYGPPGTGKTLFAKAVGSSLMANVMVVSGPETLNMYVGESERRVREIFAEARKNAPSVLVFDEFDAIAGKRSEEGGGAHRLYNGVVAQLLTEMDGFRPGGQVLVIATTNQLNKIDEALLRPGRFASIAVDLPDKEARLAIIRIYALKYSIELSASLVQILAESAVGFNGDEIESIFLQMARERKLQKSPGLSTAERLGLIVGKIRNEKEKLSGNINKRAGLDPRGDFQRFSRPTNA